MHGIKPRLDRDHRAANHHHHPSKLRRRSCSDDTRENWRARPVFSTAARSGRDGPRRPPIFRVQYRKAVSGTPRSRANARADCVPARHSTTICRHACSFMPSEHGILAPTGQDRLQAARTPLFVRSLRGGQSFGRALLNLDLDGFVEVVSHVLRRWLRQAGAPARRFDKGIVRVEPIARMTCGYQRLALSVLGFPFST